jgi:DNA-binding NarL/FixJ family response regulator
MANKEWIFSGAGIVIIGAVLKLIFMRDNTDQGTAFTPQSTESAKTHNSPNILEDIKRHVRVLFVDDDTKFKVIKILQKAGWVNSKSIKDVNSLDDVIIVNSDILFIDIQGVGLELGFKDEGLGLALALKKKYPEKKIIIYSAETKGERFHEALRKADNFLPKNAEPYEFQQIVEDYALEIYSK